MTPATADHLPASPECTLATHPGYQDLHADCRQTRDVPLPFDLGILLQRCRGRPCHWHGSSRKTPTPPAR